MTCAHHQVNSGNFSLQVTNAGAIELVQGCPDLVYLNFMSCGVSDDGIRQFSKVLFKLHKYICLKMCC